MDSYVNNLHDTFKPLYAAWLPDEPLKLGDYGELVGTGWFKRNKFIRRGNITTAFGIKFVIRNDTTTGNYTYESTGSLGTNFSSKGEGGNVKAGLEISFSSSNAIFFAAAGCLHDSIENLLEVVDGIKKAYREDRWDESHVFVCKIVNAGATTVITSRSKQASISLEAENDAIPEIDLADAGIRLSVKKSNGTGLKITTKERLTPLIGLARVLPEESSTGDIAILKVMSKDALIAESLKHTLEKEKEEEFTGKTFYL